MSCIISGLVEVPINTEYKEATLEHQVRAVKPRFGIIDAEFASRSPSAADRTDTSSISLVIGNDGDRRQGQEQLAGAGWRLRRPDQAKEAAEALPEVRYTDLCHIMFTSGTTGPSKGVRMPQAQSYLFAEEDVSLVRLTDDDVRMTAFPLFHGQEVLVRRSRPCSSGAELVLYLRFSAAAWLSGCRRRRRRSRIS